MELAGRIFDGAVKPEHMMLIVKNRNISKYFGVLAFLVFGFTAATEASVGEKLYVANRDSASVSIIDVLNFTATPEEVAVGGDPLAFAISSDGSKLYVANNGNATVSVIDTSNPAAGSHQ